MKTKSKTSPRASKVAPQPKPKPRAKAKPSAKAAGEKTRKAALAEIESRLATMPAEADAPSDGAATGVTEFFKGDEPATSKSAERGGKAKAAKPQPKARSAKAAKPGKGSTPAKAGKAPKAKKVSGLDAAAIVLADRKVPMKATEILAEIQKRGLWTSGGQTPEATLYAAIIREIAAKGTASRFAKHDRGLFVARRS